MQVQPRILIRRSSAGRLSQAGTGGPAQGFRHVLRSLRYFLKYCRKNEDGSLAGAELILCAPDCHFQLEADTEETLRSQAVYRRLCFTSAHHARSVWSSETQVFMYLAGKASSLQHWKGSRLLRSSQSHLAGYQRPRQPQRSIKV